MTWGTLYLAGEWVIRIGALFYVPQRRSPAAARAWLLLIFFLPFVGLALYALIGRAFLPRRRLALQTKVYSAIRKVAPEAVTGPEARHGGAATALPPELAPALALAAHLSEFPVVAGNRFELLSDYDAALGRLMADVDAATRSVHMLYYIFEDDDAGRAMADALERATGRGVTVRLLMDAIGSRGGLRGLGARLRAAGVDVIAAQPLRLWGPNRARLDLRNHRKISVIDDRIAFFGSQNVVSAHANRGLTNEEMMVRASGPIVRQLDAVLLADRYIETGDMPSELRGREPPAAGVDAAAVGAPAQVLPSGPGYNAGTTESIMIAMMYAARSRIVLTTPYFVPSEPFLLAMTSAARRGVAVHLIVDRTSNKPVVQYAQASFYDELLAAGVQIHAYYGAFLHAKHMSIDDDAVLIGSSNFDIRSFALNAEVSVLVYDRAVAGDLARIQARALAASETIDPDAWSRRGRARRIGESLARLTDSLL